MDEEKFRAFVAETLERIASSLDSIESQLSLLADIESRLGHLEMHAMDLRDAGGG